MFAIRDPELRLSRAGEPYLWLRIADRTGSLDAVRFRVGPSGAQTPASLARITGDVSSWRGSLSVRVATLEPVESFDRSDLVPTTPQDTVALRRRLNRALGSIADDGLRGLVREVFSEPGVAARFAECPATESGHHAYLGGLLEHTVAVVDACARLARAYPSVDAGLLTAAAILHDLGTVDALDFDVAIETTERGRLLGHIEPGISRLQAAARRRDADPDHVLRLAHAIASHHGGTGVSRRAPATLEAFVLASADALDSGLWDMGAQARACAGVSTAPYLRAVG